MPRTRQVRLFRNGRNQAVRIPREFELPGREATIRKVGERLILEPVRRKSLLRMLEAMTPLAPDDEFPDVDETLPPLDEDPFEPGKTSDWSVNGSRLKTGSRRGATIVSGVAAASTASATASSSAACSRAVAISAAWKDAVGRRDWWPMRAIARVRWLAVEAGGSAPCPVTHGSASPTCRHDRASDQSSRTAPARRPPTVGRNGGPGEPRLRLISAPCAASGFRGFRPPAAPTFPRS